jgi:competence protein ComEC
MLDGLLLPLRTEGFDAVRRRTGAQAWMREPDIELLRRPSGMFSMAAALRSSLRRATAGLEPSVAGLLEGLSIGRTDGIDQIAQENLRRAGLSHLVAVSGSNVALVLGCALLVTARLALWARVGAGLLVLACYVAVVGPDPSVLRAGVMGAIALIALGAGRRSVSLQTLALALVAVLTFKPQLVGSVGLQLSAAATAGIILWGGDIAARVRGPRPLGLALGATIAAQLAVAPILVGVFGELSVAATFANLLAIPAVPPATVLALGAGVVGVVSDPLARVPAAAAGPFARWILAVGDRLGAPDWAVLEMPNGAWILFATPLIMLVAKTVRRRGPG